jgi:hypothetical protein
MHRTYEFHVRGPDGEGQWRVVTCPAEQVMERARQLLEEPEAAEVEVREAGRHLFTMAR